MKVLNNTNSQNLIINVADRFMTDLGREEALQQFEDETLRSIINPVENYETMRFIHDSYASSNLLGQTQTDIWFNFFFYNNESPQTHDGGLDYSLVGITPQENALLLAQFTHSFFRLEFYKVPDGEIPQRTNRRLVFTKNISITSGEKIFFTTMNEYIHVPVFTGSNYRKTENMYLFWFQDESALSGSTLTGTTFYVTARFFNTNDGSISNFANIDMQTTDIIDEATDLYYQMEIDRSDYSYQFFEFNGTTGARIGQSGNPINFYEILSG